MKKSVLLPVLFMFSTFIYAQSMDTARTYPSAPVTKDDKVFTIVENMPQFPGGDKALTEFMVTHVKYPELARNNDVKGKVYVSFVVDKDGNVVEPKIMRGIGAGCDEEVLRVMKLMPKWTPGTQSGKAVNVQYMLPVAFGITDKKK